MEGELQQILGRNLRAYRKAHNLSQEGFADIMGVHRTYMGGLERGERNLTLRSLERIGAEHETAVVVTHGGVIRAGLATWLGIPDEAIFRIDLAYGGMTIVDRIEDTPVVRIVNG